MGERRYHSPIADGLSVLSSPNFRRGVSEANQALAAKTEVTKRGEHLPPNRDPENIIKQHITPHFPDDYIGSSVTITNVTESDELAVRQLKGELCHQRLKHLQSISAHKHWQRWLFVPGKVRIIFRSPKRQSAIFSNLMSIYQLICWRIIFRLKP